MNEPLKASTVQEAHAEYLGALEAADSALKRLLLLTPEGEKPEGAKAAPRLFTPEMLRSAQRVGDFLSDARLHGLVVAQNVMNFTEEAREAALEAQKGRFKVVGEGEAAPEAPADAP